MRHSKGIQGIRKFLTANASNWHVFVQYKRCAPGMPEYYGFIGAPFSTVAEKFSEFEFTGWTGNGVFFKEIGE